VEAHLMLGELLLRQGRPGFAIDEFDRAVELSPKRFQPFGKLRAAEVRLLGGEEAAKALADLAEAENEALENPEILAQIAMVYAKAAASVPGFEAKAAAVWRRVLALNPGDPRARR